MLRLDQLRETLARRSSAGQPGNIWRSGSLASSSMPRVLAAPSFTGIDTHRPSMKNTRECVMSSMWRT
jgi:hypothetical protein